MSFNIGIMSDLCDIIPILNDIIPNICDTSSLNGAYKTGDAALPLQRLPFVFLHAPRKACVL